MMKANSSRFKRTLAMLLAVVTLISLVPTSVIATVAESIRSSSYIPGDVNGDGLVNALDINLVRRHIAGGYDVEINTLAADVDADGSVTAKDVTNLRKYIAGGYGVELLRGLERFTVKFETGSGTKIEDQTVLQGTLISSLQKPYWAEHIFVGWCYDAELKKPVASTDKVTGNMTLYANWLEQVPLDTVDSVNFASAVDVDPDFAVTVLSSDPNMTADDVLAALDADDLTDPDAKDIITVSGADGVFTVKGNGGFKEGYSYRIALLSDKLTFKDEDASARQYNFTVHRDEVMNLTMQGDIKYLPLSEVSNIVNNGQSVSTLNITLYQTDGENVTITELSKGTFQYTGETAVKVGDIICIYEGEIPTNRTKDTPKDRMGDMAYLEIAGIEGNTYTYVSADAEDVIFTPDVLPVPQSADTDSDENTITVENKYLDYSADIYSYNNLDSQTTVDIGDFLAFYTGEYGVESGENANVLVGYGKVAQVKDNGNDTTTITYILVTWEDVESCMDVYTEEEMSAQELLEGVNIEEMESEIEQQAIDSGFADIIGAANDYNQVTLNAVWEVNTYTITYNLGMHAASDAHGNPTEYSAELGADVVLKDLTPKSGFQFGGWYTNPEFTGAKVTAIACTDTTDYVLYAKWEHGGKFSVTQTSVDGYKVTFTVTRTIPEGAVGTVANQNVYVRTQNGTAYGTTADSTGQDKYHFIHSYAVLAFGPNDTAKTFTVTEKDNYLENYVSASYQIGGKARTYRVEIYKVENNAGGLSGTIDKGSATRTMPVSPYNVADVYNLTATKTLIDSTEVGISSSKSYTANPAAMFEAVASDQQEQYRDCISGGNPKYEYKVTVELRGGSSSMATMSLYTLPSDGGTAVLRGGYLVMSGLSSSYQTLTAPFKEEQIGTYVNNGTGTNALVFKVKAKKDITADEIQNVINLYLAFPVSGVGGSFSTNIGTVTATVKDFRGN